MSLLFEREKTARQLMAFNCSRLVTTIATTTKIVVETNKAKHIHNISTLSLSQCQMQCKMSFNSFKFC